MTLIKFYVVVLVITIAVFMFLVPLTYGQDVMRWSPTTPAGGLVVDPSYRTKIATGDHFGWDTTFPHNYYNNDVHYNSDGDIYNTSTNVEAEEYNQGVGNGDETEFEFNSTNNH